MLWQLWRARECTTDKLLKHVPTQVGEFASLTFGTFPQVLVTALGLKTGQVKVLTAPYIYYSRLQVEGGCIHAARDFGRLRPLHGRQGAL